MIVAEALRDAARQLAPASDTARLDAELLMAHALGVSRSDLLLRHMADAVPDGFDTLVARRAASEPVAYITGVQEFYGLDLMVTRDVLIPRGDSEAIIEAAREAFQDMEPPRRLLDLGTGSGGVLLAALTVWPEAEGYGIDISMEALFVAVRNAQRHANTPIGIVGGNPFDNPEPPRRADRGMARFLQGDWTKKGWSEDLGRFDLVLANPPYVEDAADLDASVRDFEPAGALFAGPEGLDDYRVLIPQLPGILSESGVAVLEIGASQAESVSKIARSAGFSVECRCDLAGRPRALVLRLGLGK